MRLDEYAAFDGLGLAELVRAGEVSAGELTELACAAAEAVNPTLNGILEIYDDAAQVAEAAGRRGDAAPFLGVPTLRKDIGAREAGRLQENGCRLSAGLTAGGESHLMARLRAAGLALLGRTSTSELGMSGTVETAIAGDTRNPWDPTRIAGGSSGGAAACVAAGVVPLAHASDGAGSIRIPAALCGTVGLKPTRGRVTAGPAAGAIMYGLTTELVVSRSVRDTAAALDAVAAPAAGDPYVIVQPDGPWLGRLSAPPEPLRIGWTAEPWWPGAATEPEVRQAVENVAALLERLGHRVEAAPMADLAPERLLEAFWAVWALGQTSFADALAQRTGRPLNASTLEPVTLQVVEAGRRVSGLDVEHAMDVFNRTTRRAARFLEPYDVYLTPTMPKAPEPLGVYGSNLDIPMALWQERFLAYFCFTPLWNITGQPALSLPLAESAAGLPLGLQFVGRFGDEATLLRLGAQLEEAQPWAGRRPPIHAAAG
ncbi:MAG: amidase [Acidimicrobiales bacterium]